MLRGQHHPAIKTRQEHYKTLPYITLYDMTRTLQANIPREHGYKILNEMLTSQIHQSMRIIINDKQVLFIPGM